MKIWIPEIDIPEGIFVEIIQEGVLAAIWTHGIKGIRGRLVHGKGAIVVPLWTLEVPMLQEALQTSNPRDPISDPMDLDQEISTRDSVNSILFAQVHG